LNQTPDQSEELSSDQS